MESAGTEELTSGQTNYEAFPEYPLWGRYKRAFDWTPSGAERLLDAGCAWGYGTRFFTTKAREVHGLDPNATAIQVAQSRYPAVSFVTSGLEATPFPDAAFDVIVSCETLEHVADDQACISELMRILKPGGVAVLTMPHSGLLGFMDPENWGVAAMIWVRAHLPGLYRRYKRLVGRDVDPDELQDTEHRHYSLADLTGMSTGPPMLAATASTVSFGRDSSSKCWSATLTTSYIACSRNA